MSSSGDTDGNDATHVHKTVSEPNEHAKLYELHLPREVSAPELAYTDCGSARFAEDDGSYIAEVELREGEAGSRHHLLRSESSSAIFTQSTAFDSPPVLPERQHGDSHHYQHHSSESERNSSSSSRSGSGGTSHTTSSHGSSESRHSQHSSEGLKSDPSNDYKVSPHDQTPEPTKNKMKIPPPTPKSVVTVVADPAPVGIASPTIRTPLSSVRSPLYGGQKSSFMMRRAMTPSLETSAQFTPAIAIGFNLASEKVNRKYMSFISTPNPSYICTDLESYQRDSFSAAPFTMEPTASFFPPEYTAAAATPMTAPSVRMSYLELSEEEEKEEREALKKDTWKTAYLGLCFCVIYIAANTSQALLSNVFPGTGLQSLCITSVTFAFSCFFSAAFVRVFGRKKTMIFGSFIILLFLVGAVTHVKWIFLLMSAFFGFATAPLWIAQGVYMSRIVQRHPDDIGRLNSIFLTIYFISLFFGNFVIGCLMLSQEKSGVTTDVDTIFYIFIGVAIVGTIMFIFLRKAPKALVKIPPQPLAKSALATLSLFKNKTMYGLIPYFFYSGLASSFTWGRTPMLIRASTDSLALVPFGLMCYGIGMFCGSCFMGKAFDKFGWRRLLPCHIVLVAITYSLVPIGVNTGEITYFIISYLTLGVLETINSTVIQSTVLAYFMDNPTPAFSFYRFLESVGRGLGYLITQYVSYQVYEAILCSSIVISIVSYVLCFHNKTPPAFHKGTPTTTKENPEMKSETV